MFASQLVDIAAVELIPNGPVAQRGLEVITSGDVISAAPI